jgi:7,8-dihydroneopterin aldolase/epimerase/oxygenase
MAESTHLLASTAMYNAFYLGQSRECFMPQDIVFIEDLRIDTIIGIYDWERKVKQTIALDIEMAADNVKPASSENIDDALNYKAVAKRLIAFTEESQFQLVETLAERLVEIIRTEFDVPWCRLKLSKLGAVTGSRSVGVIIERGQR